MKDLNVEENVIREIKINSFLDHPNIAKLYSFFHDKKYLYLVCEYATDKNLYEAIKQPKYKLKKGLQSEEVSKIVGQICDAVEYIHKNDILHRDIKPENILLTMVILSSYSFI